MAPVLLPVRDRTKRQSRLPRPERLMKEEMHSTPMKKTMIWLPKPSFTISEKPAVPWRARAIIPSRPVMWKGRASVIQSTRQKASVPTDTRPAGLRVTSPAVKRPSGRGR